MNKEILKAQFCVIGGGLAGLSAAVAAARRGVKTILIHDRPVLGGNASSEIRMWVCGSNKILETGFVEELRLENVYRNPNANYSVWDTVLYGKAIAEPNLTLLLNTTCLDSVMEGTRIRAVEAWQLTTYRRYEIQADYFADCSGDSILAESTGAEYRVGHESRSEFGESIAPEQADRKTMGMSCLLQAREMSTPQKFIAPEWANRYESDADLPNRPHMMTPSQNFWWIELGGEDDSIRDTEKVRDELLKVTLGVWDHIKNRGDHQADNWALEWIGFLPGKRESRRYTGDHLMNQHDVESGGRFADIVAYGGWTMDDHHPAGFRYPGEPTIFHPAPCDFGISYRSLYSRNIDNLWFAGRNISVTHVALSSTRVMATCACMGEAVGIAASIAARENISPRETGKRFIAELQQQLLWNDCYLPQMKISNSELCRAAKLSAPDGDPELLRSETIRGESGRWSGKSAAYEFPEPKKVEEIQIVFDSGVEKRIRGIEKLNMRSNIPADFKALSLPPELIRGFRVTGVDEQGNPFPIYETTENRKRLIQLPVNRLCRKILLEIHDQVPRNVLSFRIR